MAKSQVKDDFNKFCQTTGAHGFNYLVAPSKTVRITWIVIVVLATCFGVLHLYSLISQYLEYGYHESTVINTDIAPVFPEITICDNSGIAESTISRFEGVLPLLGKLISWASDMYMLSGSGKARTLERLRDLSSLFYSNLDRHHRALIGVKFDGLVVSCKFNGEECTEANFKPYLHPSLINCFTFQSNQTDQLQSRNLLTGPQTGLSLILRSEPNANFMYNPIDNTQNVDSIRLAIHAPGTVPFLMNKGINLKSGMSTSVSLMMKTYDRLGSPYAKCQSEQRFKVDYRTFVSTSDVCREKCITDALRNECNCTSTLFEDLTQSYHNFCLNLSDKFLQSGGTMQSKGMCESQFVKYVANGIRCEHCVWDCYEIDYEREVAYSDWPHENKITDFIDMYVNRSYWQWPTERPCNDTIKEFYALLLRKANISSDLCPVSSNITDNRIPISMVTLSNAMRDFKDLFQFAGVDLPNTYRYVVDVPTSYYKVKTVDELNTKWVKESFYRLNIYFRQSTVEQHSQIPSFTFADLWSGIGGILGLWVGISVITIIEMCTFIFKPIIGLFQKDSKVGNRINVEQVEPP